MGATPFLSEVATEWEQPCFQEKTVNQNQEKTTAIREVALLHRWSHTPKVRDFWRGLAASNRVGLLSPLRYRRMSTGHPSSHCKLQADLDGPGGEAVFEVG